MTTSPKPGDPQYAAYLQACRDRRAAILAHYATSKSYSATAREFGISRQRVAQFVAESVGKPRAAR